MEQLRLYYPIKPYSIVQAFGQCDASVCDKYKAMGLKGHNGDDVICASDTPLRACFDGVVTFAGLDGSNGSLLVIRTDKQYEYKGEPTYFKALYAHLRPNIPVKAGDKVYVGDIIAYSDNTGMSTGPHLHFGLKPVYKGEQEWEWYNIEQSNGYHGAIAADPYWTGIFAVDYAPLVSLNSLLIKTLEALVSLLKGRN